MILSKAQQLDRKLDEILILLVALVDEDNDRAAAKKLAADIGKRTAALAAAIPPSGNPTP